MGSPIATKKSGFMCFSFPDVCKTQVGPLTIPIPYPNIGDLINAEQVATTVYANGDPVILQTSIIPDKKTTGDEAGALGSVGGDFPGSIKGQVEFTSASSSVFADNGKPVVRMFDSTKQNNGNAIGQVLGGVPHVLVGD